MSEWISLDDRRPTGSECVLLYPVITDVGHLYTISNPDYVRGPHCKEQGFTHWMPFKPHPNEAEQYLINSRLYENDQ